MERREAGREGGKGRGGREGEGWAEREQPQNGKGVIEWTGRTNLLLLKAAVILQT